MPTSDPFKLADYPGAFIWRQTAGRVQRSPKIDPTKKTLVLIAAGQSNMMNIGPTPTVPVNAAAIDNFNIYDGGLYSVTGALLGCTENTNSLVNGGPATYGVGHVATRIADKFVAAGVFDRVIIVSIAIGGTSANEWATGGVLADRIPATMRRLASRGLVPGMTGVTFAMVWMQGENDTYFGTSQAAMTASLNSIFANTFAAGFVGRIFVPQVSWDLGNVSAAVRAAQLAVVNGGTIRFGGDIDTLNNTYRQDTVHLADNGQAAAADIVFTNMRASGAPL